MEKQISISDFQKLDIRIGKVVSANRVQNTEKLLILEFDFGEFKRQIVSAIAHQYDPDDLIGKQMPVLVNLEPKRIRGFESQGMILAIDVGEDCALLHPNKEIPDGSKVT
jgi:methionine--tRNA ligase beta chain